MGRLLNSAVPLLLLGAAAAVKFRLHAANGTAAAAADDFAIGCANTSASAAGSLPATRLKERQGLLQTRGWPLLPARQNLPPTTDLLMVKQGQEPSFAFCAIPKNAAQAWRRLVLRASGSQAWNHTTKPIVWRDDPELLEVAGPPPSNGQVVKATMIRDPVTRLLATYLGDCRRFGNWSRCGLQSPRDFDTFVKGVKEMRQRGTMLDHLRPQTSFCGLESAFGDYVFGRYDHFQFDANMLLRRAGLWEDYGSSRWGATGESSFDHVIMSDECSHKVCEFFTTESLDFVEAMYETDYNVFRRLGEVGYSADNWRAKCAPVWNQRLREVQVLESAAVMRDYGHPSACTPTEVELDTLRDNFMDPPPVPTIKFFIHESGAFNFSEATNCFLRVVGARRDLWGIDDQVPANVAEHLGELQLLDLLSNHPLRVYDPDEAELQIIGTPVFISFQSSLMDGQCGTVADHNNRMELLRAELEALPSFRRSRGSDFFMFTTHFWVEHVYTQAVMELLNEGRIIVGTADSLYFDWQGFPHVRRDIILPYRAHSRVEEESINTGDPAVVPPQRPFSFVFHGDMNRHEEGAERPMLLDFGKGIKNTDIRNASFGDMDFSVARQTAERYMQSNFCFVPAGDTPTSRRLYDALGAGCIPLVLVDYDAIVRNLPFGRSINWANILVFGGSLLCNAQSMEYSLGWLQRLMSMPESTLANFRAAGQAAFRNMLSFSQDNSMATALLVELELVIRRGLSAEDA